MKYTLRAVLAITLLIFGLSFMVLAQITLDYPTLFGTILYTRLVTAAAWILTILCDVGLFFLLLPIAKNIKEKDD